MPVRAHVLGAALLLSAATSAPVVLAQAPASTGTAEDRKQAAKDFADGDRAFKEGDYRQAALSYENAYHRVPHHSALWNAARSWHRAGELSKAANLYAQYLREAPAKARDRNNAQKAMNELSKKLARLEIHATDVTDVKIDDAPAGAPSVFVTPGEHVLEGRAEDGRAVRQTQTVQAGDVVSVALVPPPAVGPPRPAVVAEPASPVARPRPSHGWSPVIVYFEGAVTLALTGITIWSGVDTLQQKDTFDRNPTQQNLDVGQQREARTNVLIGVSAAAGVATALTAMFLVDWHVGAGTDDEKREAEPRVTVGAGLGTVSVHGEF